MKLQSMRLSFVSLTLGSAILLAIWLTWESPPVVSGVAPRLDQQQGPALDNVVVAATSEVVEPLDRKRVTTSLVVLTEDDHPVATASAYLVDGAMRFIPSELMIASADAQGKILLPSTLSSSAQSVQSLTIHADGFASKNIGNVASLRDGDVVRLHHLPRVCVHLLEGIRPIASADVAVSLRELPDSGVFAGESSTPGVAGSVGAISVGTTKPDGTVWLHVPEPGLCIFRVQKAGFLAVQGTPFSHRIEGREEIIEVQMRRVYGGQCEIRGDHLLSYSYRMPSELETPAASIAHLHQMRERGRDYASQSLLVVGSRRKPVFLGVGDDDTIKMDIQCWTSNRGLVSMPLQLRWLGLTSELQVLDISAHEEMPHASLAVRFVDREGREVNIGDVPLRLLLLNGERVVQAVSIHHFGGVLPVGAYAVGHRFDNVLQACVVATEKSFELLPGVDKTHQVVLDYLPREVSLQLRTNDGLAVCGARCLFEREEECDLPGPRRVLRMHPNVQTASFWLPPGRWQLTLTAFDGREPVHRTLVVVHDPESHDKIVVE